ncbi:MAG TPA: nuclear transport factor 2 family protein [Streptosporangiaceae bacterium]|jgi:ketosteroid isomerase-like protein|nr:nuclear transport factor 2 family protein [Streptosporangiaceae bacterium]
MNQPRRPGTTEEARIRALIEHRVPALAAKDAAALTRPDAPGLVLFDLVGPLRWRGGPAHAQRVADWLGSYQGPIGYQIRDLEVAVGGDLAWCHYLYRVSGTMIDGTQVGMWARATVCLRRTGAADTGDDDTGDDWAIVHEHSSVPMDAATGAAALDLQP